MKISFPQKFFLVFFGTLITLFILEGGLRLGGFLFSLNQQRGNKTDFSSSTDQYRILCIGESTTALGDSDSYPSQLEVFLNSQGLKQKVKIINRGLVAKTSNDILASLPVDLKTYQPHLVIAMIGANDRDNTMQDSLWIRWNVFWEHFRSYKLFKLAWQHFNHKINDHKEEPLIEISDPLIDGLDINQDSEEAYRTVKKAWLSTQVLSAKLQNTINTLVDPAQKKQRILELIELRRRNIMMTVFLAEYCRLRERYKEAEEYLKIAIGQNPDNAALYLALGRCYREDGNFKGAIVLLRKSLELSPDSDLTIMELGRSYDAVGADEEVFKVYQLMINKNVNNVYWYYPEIGTWFKQHQHFPQAEKAFKMVIQKNPESYFLHSQLEEVLLAQGKNEEAKTFQEKADLFKYKEEYYFPQTIVNYNKIADKVLTSGARLICMQYPMRNIEPLKKILNYRKDVIFVANHDNFSQAVKSHSYSDFFTDNFAKDFGHCTRKGNQLIVDNVARAIMKEIFLQ